jgi:ATP-dependent Clp protease adaptor protein ClpS
MSQRRDEEGGVKTAPQVRVDKPPMYKVVFHNDDYTPMEFVVFVLQSVFKHTLASAARVMLLVHQSGVGVAGVYTREVAETRLAKAMDLAREKGHPLQITMESE